MTIGRHAAHCAQMARKFLYINNIGGYKIILAPHL